jgi:glucose-6-phosphate dehydrogenase assembly protein OpcA
MADTLKVLGQSNPSATTLTTLYTVPSSTSTTVSSLVVCNQASSAATFRISIQVAAAADTAKQYLYYDTNVPANDTFIATVGITLATTDVVKCYASSTTLSFNLFGVEVT